MRVRVLGHYMNRPFMLLAVGEAALCWACTYVAALIRVDVDLGQTRQMLGPYGVRALVVAPLVLAALTSTGLYSVRQRANMTGIAQRIVLGVIAALAGLPILFYFLPSLLIPPAVSGLTAVILIPALILVRAAFYRLADTSVLKPRVLVLGTGRHALSILQLRRRADQRGFHIVGFAATDESRSLVPPDRIVELSGSLLDYARANDVGEIVVCIDDRRRAFPIPDLLACRLAGIDVTDALHFFEREAGKIRLSILNPSWIIFGEGFSREPVGELTARIFDVLVSVGLLVVVWPLMLLAVLAIKVEDGLRASVIYRQQRVGLNGSLFDVFKFRSMRTDAETNGAARWAVRGDPRVTRVGRLIRATRIDELPQLLNVLMGQMRFVGPRPERPEFVRELSDKIPYYAERHCVKPGITGWAQLCYPYGASEADAFEKLEYDLYYIKHRSLAFDMTILLQTVEVILWRKGAR